MEVVPWRARVAFILSGTLAFFSGGGISRATDPRGGESLPLLLRWSPAMKPLVRVGEELITTYDRDCYLFVLRALSQESITSPPLPEEQELRLLELIRLHLLFPLARASRIIVPQERVEEEIGKLLTTYGISPEDLEDHLGVSRQRLSRELERIFITQEYTQRGIARQIFVTEEEVVNFLHSNPSRFSHHAPDEQRSLAKKLLFLKKLRLELQKILSRQYQATPFHWYISPFSEERILSSWSSSGE